MLCTEELTRRPERSPDYQAENRALTSIAEAIGDQPDTLLQRLADIALALCHADSAGVSILESDNGRDVFRWRAMAGQLAGKVHGGMPLHDSPSGLVLHHNRAMLFVHPEEYFDFGIALARPMVEALVVPFRAGRERCGTIWAIAHTPAMRFDEEHLRVLTSLSHAAAIGYQAASALHRLSANVQTSAHPACGSSVDDAGPDGVSGSVKLDASELGRALQASESRYRFLADLTTLSQLNDPRALINTLCRKVMERLGCNLFLNYLWHPQAKRLRLFAQEGLPADIASNIEWLELGQGVCGAVAQQRCQIVAEDIQSSDDPRISLARPLGLQGYACFPLLSNNDLLGTLSFGLSTRKSFAPFEVELMRTISAHVAESIRRIQDQQLVRDREASLRAVLDTAVDAIITIDHRRIIVSANKAAERIFGYSREELLGRNVNQLMPPPFRDEHDSYVQRYLATGERKIIGRGREATAQRRDGSTFPIELYVSEIDHEGRFTGFIRDITERKELQCSVLEAAAEEQRRIAYELHDGIQQEITGLSLFASLVCRIAREIRQTLEPSIESENPEAKRPAAALALLQDTADRLSQGLAVTHRHLQELARGILPVAVDAEGLREALESLAAAVGPQAKCRFACSGDVRVVDNTTASHVYRIAQESLNNALRHGRADSVQISLTATENHLELEVADNGIGFDSSQATHGMGLRTMEYRAGLIGGVLQIEKSPRGGVLLRCAFPRPVGPFKSAAAQARQSNAVSP